MGNKIKINIQTNEDLCFNNNNIYDRYSKIREEQEI